MGGVRYLGAWGLGTIILLGFDGLPGVGELCARWVGRPGWAGAGEGADTR